MKKAFKIIKRSVLVGIMMAIIYTAYSVIREKSVLEEIAIAGKKDNITKFNEVTIIEEQKAFTRDDVRKDEVYGVLFIDYEEEYLEENFEISLFFPVERDYVTIINHIAISDNIVLVTMITYYHKKKTIIYEPIDVRVYNDSKICEVYCDSETINKYLKECNVSKEDISDYQEYALYDVVVKSWIDAFGGSYDIEKKYIESLKMIDNTYDFSEEE